MLKQQMREKTKRSAETPGWAAEIIEKIEAKLFMWGWRKTNCKKNELNIISKNSIVKYDIIIH